MSKQKAKAMIQIPIDDKKHYTVDVDHIIAHSFNKDNNKLSITVEGLKTIYTKEISELNLLKAIKLAKDTIDIEKHSFFCVIDAKELDLII